MMLLAENTKAPNFELMDNENQSHSLKKPVKKLFILYFYPKDNTPGCTTQACNFRDNLAVLAENNCSVYGISRDSSTSHSKFQAKYDLNFTLLSDPDLKVHKAYQVLTDDNKTIRSTFLIDGTGTLIKIWPKVKVAGHVEEVLKAIREH